MAITLKKSANDHHLLYLLVNSDTIYVTVWLGLPRTHVRVVYLPKHLELYSLLQEVYILTVLATTESSFHF